MTFTYAQVKERSKLLLAMPGLTQAAFEHLLPAFAKAWAEYVRQTSMEREDRQRQYGGGRAETTLGAIEEKLLCILYYVKVYPLQEILAFEFGMTPSTANEWIPLRSGVLKNALEEEGSLPVRDPQQGASVLEAAPASAYGIDGTERRRQRPNDPDKQQEYYRGKKKHTRSRISLLAALIQARFRI